MRAPAAMASMPLEHQSALLVFAQPPRYSIWRRKRRGLRAAHGHREVEADGHGLPAASEHRQNDSRSRRARKPIAGDGRADGGVRQLVGLAHVRIRPRAGRGTRLTTLRPGVGRSAIARGGSGCRPTDRRGLSASRPVRRRPRPGRPHSGALPSNGPSTRGGHVDLLGGGDRAGDAAGRSTAPAARSARSGRCRAARRAASRTTRPCSRAAAESRGDAGVRAHRPGLEHALEDRPSAVDHVEKNRRGCPAPRRRGRRMRTSA